MQIEGAVHSLKKSMVDVRLRIVFAILFQSGIRHGWRAWLQDPAGLLDAGARLHQNRRRQIRGAAGLVLQLPE